MSDLAIIISSCNKYSGLWEQNVKHIRKNWIGNIPDIYIVTDFESNIMIEGVQILFFDGNLPQRINKAISIINNNYFLITLDDYFLIGKTFSQDFDYLVDYCRNENCHYLQLYDRRRRKKRNTTIDQIRNIDLKEDYAVCLYPAIWEKNFFAFCSSYNCSPWEFEPKLTNLAIKYKANCKYEMKKCFEILDVIRKGKILHKAKRYIRHNNIDIGSWKVVPIFTEIKLFFADRISWYAPKFLYNFLKKIARKFGMKFYSDHKDI